MNKQMIDGWIEGRQGRVAVDRKKLAVYREAAGITSWKALADRCGVSEAMTPPEPEKDDSNNSMENWLKFSLAVGRHPFDLGYIIWPENFGQPVAPEWPEVVFNADREVWGFDTEEIEELIASGKAHFGLDRRKIAVYREAVGITTWKALSALSGVNVHTLQTLAKPESNPSCSTWMRVALAVRVHPYAIVDVRLPGVKPQPRLKNREVAVVPS